jgi:multiple sugar transport system permease protein
LYNTIYAGMVLYVATDVLQIYVFLQFVRRIPYEIDESALLDGSSFFRIYWSIILPQMKPAIATVAIIKMLGVYNDMFTPYLYMPKSTLRTVTTAIMMFSYDRNSQWNVMAAGILAVMIPTLILYLFAQRSIIAGITEGAVKG